VPRYLADTSIWGWANSGRRPDIQEKLAWRFERGEVLTCVPVALEALHRPRTGEEYETLFSRLFEPLDWLELARSASARALEVQREMAQTKHGNHLRPAIDFLVAAIAEAGADEVVLWSFDRDLKLICEHTGQPHESESAD
jgi:predicted nucleic acid-binding protein